MAKQPILLAYGHSYWCSLDLGGLFPVWPQDHSECTGSSRLKRSGKEGGRRTPTTPSSTRRNRRGPFRAQGIAGVPTSSVPSGMADRLGPFRVADGSPPAWACFVETDPTPKSMVEEILTAKVWFWLAFVLSLILWAAAIVEIPYGFWAVARIAPWAFLLSIAAGIGYKRIGAMGGWK